MSEPPVMWNPFSMDYKVLPESGADYPAEPDAYSRTTFGFGYDSANDDYKVVRIVEFRNERTHIWMRSEAMIYGLQSNQWRRIGRFPYPLPFLRGHWRVHVRGALHTLVAGHDSPFAVKIMAFSLETEAHYEVAMPSGIQIRGVDLSLDVIDGYLSLVCAYKSRVVIWVMKEYGVKESWTKLLSISPPAVEPGDFVKPLVYSREGDRILLNCSDKTLIWYDLSKRTVESLLVDGMPFVFYAEPCIETLVSPNGSIPVEKLGQGKRKAKKTVKNKR